MNISLTRALAGIAGVLAIAALLAGDPAMSETIKTIDAVTLAEWIRDRKANLRVIDVRSRAEYDQYRIPTAENVSADQVAADSNQVVVLYSDGDASAHQAAAQLQSAHVYVLEGGIYDWLDRVMAPALPPDATAAQQAEFARQKAVSEYFGGAPTIFAETQPKPATAADAVKRLRRKTC
jgi:rhodanese-related sulfurtransferase